LGEESWFTVCLLSLSRCRALYICEHRDDGRAGGVFTSYEIVKVVKIMSTVSMVLHCWCCVRCVCVCVCYSSVHYGLHVMVFHS